MFSLIIVVVACQPEDAPIVPTLRPTINPLPTTTGTELASPTVSIPPSATSFVVPTSPPLPSLEPTRPPSATSPSTATQVLTSTAPPTLAGVVSPRPPNSSVIELPQGALSATPPPMATLIAGLVTPQSQAQQPPLVIVTSVNTTVPQVAAAGINATVEGNTVAQVPLPLVAADLSFEGGENYQDDQVEIGVPQGWQAWWRRGQLDCTLYQQLPTDGQCPLLDDPSAVYYRPEFQVLNGDEMILGERVQNGSQAVRFFCTYGVCTAGLYRRVEAVIGQAYVFGGMAFTWCDNTPAVHEDPLISQLVTRDDQLNCEVALGIDPAGGIDPFSGNIVWITRNYYDTYQYLETPAITAQSDVITLFIRGRSLWGMHHNDFHFDNLSVR